jgi:hypothetical protein
LAHIGSGRIPPITAEKRAGTPVNRDAVTKERQQIKDLTRIGRTAEQRNFGRVAEEKPRAAGELQRNPSPDAALTVPMRGSAIGVVVNRAV